jgi:hypothetical protein
MLSGFSDLALPVLTRVLRRTVLFALVVGAAGVIVALVLGAPYAALGMGLGVGVALVNLRMLDAGVAKVETKGETNTKVVRRLLGTRTASRLAIITAAAIGLMFLNGELGIGMVIGLVIFQILFVINVGRAILSSGVV